MMFKDNIEIISSIFKTKLKIILEKYNQEYKKSLESPIQNDNYYINLNNSNKYYCYICNKSDLVRDKSDYKILYFFDESGEKNFYLEIDNTITFEYECLFEGYMYNNTNYLITDILYLNDKIVKSNYELRQFIIYEMIFYDIYKLQELNGYISIGIHPMINSESIEYTTIAKNNFQYKSEINAEEKIEIDNMKKTVYKIKSDNNLVELKRVTKTELSDVYKIYNINTNNDEGILYIQTLQDSEWMNRIFEDCDELQLNCKYISERNKWTPCCGC